MNAVSIVNIEPSSKHENNGHILLHENNGHILLERIRQLYYYLSSVNHNKYYFSYNLFSSDVIMYEILDKRNVISWQFEIIISAGTWNTALDKPVEKE